MMWFASAHGVAMRRASKGQSIVETLFVLALVAIVTIVLVSGIGRNVSHHLHETQEAIHGPDTVSTGP